MLRIRWTFPTLGPRLFEKGHFMAMLASGSVLSFFFLFPEKKCFILMFLFDQVHDVASCFFQGPPLGLLKPGCLKVQGGEAGNQTCFVPFGKRTYGIQKWRWIEDDVLFFQNSKVVIFRWLSIFRFHPFVFPGMHDSGSLDPPMEGFEPVFRRVPDES